MTVTVATRPVVRACTTAREIRTQALEPAMNIIAGGDRERHLLTILYSALTDRPQAQQACRELASLANIREKDAQTIAAFVDAAHGRDLARRMAAHVAVLSDSGSHRADKTSARDGLHGMFSEYGAVLFEKRVTDRMLASNVIRG